jgi:hypothetical protein
MTDLSDHLEELRRAAVERCEDLAVKLLGNPSMVDRQEMRWGRNGKLALRRAGNKRGLWYDFSTGKGGDIVSLVIECEAGTVGEAMAWLRRELSLPVPARPRWKPVGADERSLAERIEAARLVYGRGQEGRHSLARAYFEGRGLDVPDEVWPQIRFEPACYFDRTKARHPAVLLPFRSIATGEIIGVHKIALNADGSAFRIPDGGKLKVSGGSIIGAAIMLQPLAGNDALCVCEGAETGLGIIMGGWGAPVWALSGASFLARFEPVAGVRRLVIGADNDRVGRKAAHACMRCWQRAGRFIEIRWPDRKDEDFADEYRRRDP